MENRFDELAKAVAEGMTRREVLSRLGGVLAGGALAFLGMRAASAQGQGERVPCPHGEHVSLCRHFLGFEEKRAICCPQGKECKIESNNRPVCIVHPDFSPSPFPRPGG
jgi:hypothetical protein